METYRVMVYLKNDTIETTVQAKSPSQAKAIAESMYKDAKITILLWWLYSISLLVLVFYYSLERLWFRNYHKVIPLLYGGGNISLNICPMMTPGFNPHT
jgi:hypothetical protein